MTDQVIKYNPTIPRLDNMTDEERCRALERYMTESARQINIIADQFESRLQEAEEKWQRETTS